MNIYRVSTMSKLSSYLEQINNVSIEISKKTSIKKQKIIYDIIKCSIKYSASPNNYKKFKFYELDDDKRKTYITNGDSEKLIKKYNDNKYRDIFENKILFAQKFKKFFKRDWLDLSKVTYDEFKKFISNKTKVIYKPVDSAQAQGIEVIKVDKFKDTEELYNYLTTKYKTGILEDWIIQHEDIDKIYPNAINCLRIITIVEDNKCNIVAVNFGMGNGKEISNLATGDIVAYVDFDTGILKTDASNFSGQVFKNHPITNKKIKGFQLPFWKETCQMLEEASKVIPQVRYVGWDIAITSDGPVIIEGNTSPGYVYFQVPEILENRIGCRKNYEKFI
ncbi:sugar-transfer associated ATP-grasp domain-containing protein [Intestinibacter bartlettii]|uniref:sugar-transfer associated ATP-grasp domain-containing protein n=1 Tax=Intestinibacter bartlettii TaxID=261299 RepID=UPI000823333B|nr:sugar-transfer associated ATP-grasp domain-containing protein [Intestinibacter bartlettii]SCI71274.1 alpha-L-glutamate ligase homolog [uncultured Clostridium sp.]